MPSTRKRKSTTKTLDPSQKLLLAAADEMVEASWPTMLASLREAISNGDLVQALGPAHADALVRLLDEHEEIAKNLYRAGYGVALRNTYDGMQFAMLTTPHDCDVPGHNHGPAGSRRVGRA